LIAAGAWKKFTGHSSSFLTVFKNSAG